MSAGTEPTVTSSDAAEPSIGVLLMAYGTPRRPEEIETYYTDIRRGRPPTPEQLADLTRRYEAIGGISPLAQRTEAQRDALQAALDELAPGRFAVGLGLKHADPKVEAGVDELVELGVERIIGLVLAPHFSALSVGQYLERAAARADSRGVPFDAVESWAIEPAFVEFLAADLQQRLDAMPEGTRVIFSAHSLPARVLELGDPYPDELRSTAHAVATLVGIEAGDGWTTAWQSAGRTPEPWLGPDILDVLDVLAADGVPGVLICACGFVADHLEVLYDLDIEAAQKAARLGLAFDRVAAVNDDPRVLGALAARVAALA